ncbi:MAG: hypothetical protein ACLTTH_16035 [Holdemanella porci]
MERKKQKKNSEIPKVIHYCWFGGAELPEIAENVFNHGRNIFLGMKLKNGMNRILMLTVVIM